MVVDSIQVSPLHLPFQAWPMMMAPAYGGGEPLAPQSLLGPTMVGLGSLLPWQATPMMVPWGGQAVPVPVPGALGGQWTPQAVGLPLQTTLAAEQQALHTLLQDATAGPIRKLHDYLEAHSQKYSQLVHCIPVVQQAARAFGAHDYTQALCQISQAYRYISALRGSIPDLPNL